MFRFYAKRRRIPRWVRLLAAILLIGLVYLVTVEAVHPPAWAGNLPAGIKTKSAPRDTNAHAEQGLQQAPLVKSEDAIGRNDALARTKEDQPKVAAIKAEQQAAKMSKADTVSLKRAGADDGAETPAESKLEQGLKYIFSISPDELHVRELLRPIETSGKERLRELGLRARQFRTLLESWEAVHLVHSKDSTLIRDDIISYLSKVKDVTGISLHKPRAEIIRSYENFRYFLTKLSELLFPWTAPYFADHMTLHASIKHGGRGVVLSGGDGQLKYMMTSIRSIRKLGCTLPIEVMYLGDDDLEDDSRSELEAEPGVITRDMKQMVHDEGWDLRGWAGKPFAILLSSFREVIFIDADAMFFVNPETLFDDPAYQETGTLFFRDRLMFPENKRKWLQQILPKPMSRNVRQSRFWTGESGHMQESGVVLVDKWRHFMAMLMVTRMNGPDRDGNEERGIVGTYDMVYGDKETFWLGWELVGDTDYAFHPGDAGSMGVASDDYDTARRQVMGGIEDAQKKAQEDEEQRQLEENRRHEDELARRKELAKEGRIRKAEARRKAQEMELEKQGDTTAPEESGESTVDTAQEKSKSSEAGKGKEYNAPPSPDSEVETGGPQVDLEAGLHENMAKEQGQDPEAQAKDPEAKPDTPTGPEAFTETDPVTRKVKRALDEDAEAEEDLDSIMASRKADNQVKASGKDFTICSPQLLHLDRNNRPLWFNGWILDNKFDQDHPKLSSFESFMLERKEGAIEADWKLEENNLCCLRSDKVFTFTKQEKDALTNIVSIAKQVGALGKRR